MVALNLPPEDLIAQEMIDAFDQYDADRTDEPFDSWGISASKAGHDCMRLHWLRLRWVKLPVKLPPRVRRIMETGYVQEDTARQRLRACCKDSWPVNPKTGRQWSILRLGGWLRGRGDFIVRGAPGFPEDEVFGVEVKSHNDKNFNRIQKSKLCIANLEHYCQLQLLLWEYDLKRGLYIAVNKNTEEYLIKVIDRDDHYLQNKFRRLDETLKSNFMPPPLSLKDDFFQCKICDMRAFCKEGALPERRTCRSCIHATVVFGAKKPTMQCERHGFPLQPDEQKQGCNDHLFLPDLIPWEQVDANEEHGTITYLKPDGTQWIDRGQEIPKETEIELPADA